MQEDLPEIEVRVPIKLGQFVKLASFVGTGGEAREVIQAGYVFVNGEPVSERGRQLYGGDVVEFDDGEYVLAVRVAERS
ncbi:ribosome-associated protein [Actinobaculum suis]|uniref:RNA binding protein n=1 Tax=Actinobaculum suis TaxID=1657 RepID=A0A0K9EUI0_9ACTO|nr:RNA-binding S4 domain-containing protein [Actinobaculum suis]KMY23808.1 RNA-binding protein S4 [Actinobaculum suis]MDY5153866.1 RNA-binding S4 domain-containing protein [Actinobaculum suis]OCA93298.1 RNA-binding protein [Actinobaculum suis]OCA94452.1 RNA-binding protein [Actinobaculum suis]SDD99600.1 ribosome-associated protein [Actinobaculum suis]